MHGHGVLSLGQIEQPTWQQDRVLTQEARESLLMLKLTELP